MPPKHIFKGKHFALSGKLSQTHDAIGEAIQRLGGEVSGAVNKNTDYLIASEEDVREKKLKVATAHALGAEVLKESFLAECQAARSLLPLRKFRFRAAAAAELKRPAPKAGAGPAAKARRRLAQVPAGVEIAAEVPVIAKSGLVDSHGVVRQSIAKGHVSGSILWDVELVLNDPAAGKDKFYCIQLLAPKPGGIGYYVVYHWGKTGKDGACALDGPLESFQAARPRFLRAFRRKTGNVWGQLGEAFVDVEGKYRVVAKEDAKEAGEYRWQYYLHNEVDGKKVGWYDYDAAAAESMEKYWRQYNSNEGLAVRIIRSYFKYEVNFVEMVQKNTTSGTRRAIRRLGQGEAASEKPPPVIPEKHRPEEKRKGKEAAGAEEEESSADEEEFEDPGGDEEDEAEEGEEEGDEDAGAEMEDVTEAAEVASGKAPPEAEEAGKTEAASGVSAAPASMEGGRAPPAAASGEAEAGAGAAAEAAADADGGAASEAETVVAADLPVRVGAARRAG